MPSDELADTPDVTPKRVHADPTKDFLVTMITRDISLLDCIFDLLDNSVDGARRGHDKPASPQPFEEARISLSFSDRNFAIVDNCGGISLSDAINYAFHFGRRPGSASD